jgi:hypothetical protein
LKKKNQKNFCLRRVLENPKKEGKQSLFEGAGEGAAPERDPKTFFPLVPSRANVRAPASTQGRTKSFFASFSLRGAFAVALSQKEASCLPATCLRLFRILKRTEYPSAGVNAGAPASAPEGRTWGKAFCFFFQKKKILAFLPLAGLIICRAQREPSWKRMTRTVARMISASSSSRRCFT